MEIRPARLGDEDALLQLRAALWPAGSMEEHRAEARAFLTGRPRRTLPAEIFVADHEETLVGFVEVGLRSHADGCDPAQPCGFIEGWYVRPEFSGRGIGRALLERAEQWARERGCFEMASDTWLDNEAGQRAHEALGYEVVDRCVQYRKTLDSTDAASRPTPLYGADLARIHHEHFRQTAEAAAAQLLRRLRARGVTSGTVVDLACGSGLLSRRALDAGFDVLGVDVSSSMLEIARSHAHGARFIQGSLWDVVLPPCVAVAAVGEAFNYVTEELSPDSSRLERRFEDIARALAPGGLLLFDVAGPGRSGPTGSRQRAWGQGGATLLLDEAEDPDTRQLVRVVQTFVPAGALHRRSREDQRLALYPPQDVSGALERTGFTVEHLETYGCPAEPLTGWHVFAAERLP